MLTQFSATCRKLSQIWTLNRKVHSCNAHELDALLTESRLTSTCHIYIYVLCDHDQFTDTFCIIILFRKMQTLAQVLAMPDSSKWVATESSARIVVASPMFESFNKPIMKVLPIKCAVSGGNVLHV